MEKYQIISDFIDFLKEYDILENGKMTKSVISKNIPYSSRHFDRIFKNFSKYTPLELAEILRLLCCINSIKSGNTLKNTAYDYDYTPEGLSDVLRNKMNTTVNRIRTQDFQFEKYQMYSTFMVRLNEYTYQLDKEEFMFLLENLEGEDVLKKIVSHNPISDIDKSFELHLYYSKIFKILEEYEGLTINKRTYENIDLQEAIAMRFILEANGKEGYNEFEIRVNKLFSTIFLITFFFDIGTLKLNNDVYELSLEYGIQEIFNGLKEIEAHIGEVFDIVLQCNIVGNKVIIQLRILFKESMLWFNEFKDIN